LLASLTAAENNRSSSPDHDLFGSIIEEDTTLMLGTATGTVSAPAVGQTSSTTIPTASMSLLASSGLLLTAPTTTNGGLFDEMDRAEEEDRQRQMQEERKMQEAELQRMDQERMLILQQQQQKQAQLQQQQQQQAALMQAQLQQQQLAAMMSGGYGMQQSYPPAAVPPPKMIYAGGQHNTTMTTPDNGFYRDYPTSNPPPIQQQEQTSSMQTIPLQSPAPINYGQTNLTPDHGFYRDHPPPLQQQQQQQHSEEKRWFEFDAVIGEQSNQQDVYIKSGAHACVSEDLFAGYNATILCYGQTGAGKTHTMGSTFSVLDDEEKGVLPRACDDLFQTIYDKCDGNAEVQLSYLEIYNEEVRDLLVPENSSKNNKDLKIRETLNGEVYVSGLTAQPVNNSQDIGNYLEIASKRRVTGSTAMNAVSSRSHSICTLNIKGILENSQTFTSKLTLVDLAGSERLKKTGAEGNRAMEGIHINKSLMVLGQVVSALAQRRRQRKPPYRDSKLTRLLQDSLGGNSRTIMVACVSPADYNVEESTNTLRYATAARNIKNTATKNLLKNISQEEAALMQRENQLLKQQVAELQAVLRNLGPSPPSSTVTYLTDDESSMTDWTDQEPQNEVISLKKQLNVETLEFRKSAEGSIEVTQLKMEMGQLRERLKELEAVETENEELRQELEDAIADAAGARMAATKMTDILEHLRSLKQDELERSQLKLKYKKKEQEWVDFIAKMLDTRADQIKALQEDFELVIRVVESPAVYQMKEGKSGWFRRAEYKEVYDPELREKVLTEHVQFFKDRMDEIQTGILVRAISLQGMRDRLQNQRERMETEIGATQDEADSLEAPDQDILEKLVDMLVGPTM